MPNLEQTTLPEGVTVFSDGYPAADLFFILSGKVKIIHHQLSGDKNIGVRLAGDHFGEEALSIIQTYQTRAICLTPVTVLRIRGTKAREIADANKAINAAFSLFKKSFKLSCETHLGWRAADEGIELISRRHPFFLFLRLFLTAGAFLGLFSFLLFSALISEKFFTPLLILSLAEFLVGMVLSVWAGMEWRNDYFILTNERVCVQKKLIGFYESRHESPLNAILSVGVDTSFMGRLLGYGTVTVRTYTGDLQFKRLPYPFVIYELLEMRIAASAIEAAHTEKREIREALTGKLDRSAGRKFHKNKDGISNDSDMVEDSGSISHLLAKLFRLRTVEEETVTYRTHWWILLKKITIPGLLLLTTIIAVMARLLGFLIGIPEWVVYGTALILALIGWGWCVYQYQDWQNDNYIVTNDQLIDVNKKPLGSDDRKSAPVKNIQTVEFERKGLINLILNFGTVKIKIGNEELTFDNVYLPSEVQAEIYARYRATLDNAKKNEQQKFVEWIKTYEEIQKENRQANEDETG